MTTMRIPAADRSFSVLRGRPPAWVGAALWVVLGACGGGSEPPPSPTPPSSSVVEVTTTTAPSAPRLEPTIPGAPRTSTSLPVSLGPGDAALSGTVSGPQGPVAGAAVRVERLVGGGAVADLRSDESGGWSLGSILGGPYRLTATGSADLATLEPTLLFLGATERRTVGLSLNRLGEQVITARLVPEPPRANVTSVFTVRVGTSRIDSSGSVVIEPRPAVRLQLVSEGLAITAPAQLTDGAGKVAWQVRCLQAGPVTVTLLVGNGLTTGTGASMVAFPECTPGPSTTVAATTVVDEVFVPAPQ